MVRNCWRRWEKTWRAESTNALKLLHIDGFNITMPCKTAVSQCVDARMILEARAAGCTVVGGLSILLQKNAEVFRLFTGKQMPVEDMQQDFFR